MPAEEGGPGSREDFFARVSCLPEGVPARYRAVTANENVVLYEGQITVKRTSEASRGPGSVTLTWQPSPRLTLDYLAVDDVSESGDGRRVLLAHDDLGTATVLLEDITTVAEARLTSMHTDFASPRHFLGEVRAFDRGEPSDLARVDFHVLNFPAFSGNRCHFMDSEGGMRLCDRLELTGEGWRIALNTLPSTADVVSELCRGGGYGITHAGRLERSDGSLFTADEAKEALEALSTFLTFARGQRSGTALFSGFGAGRNLKWESWHIDRVDQWASVSTWLPDDSILPVAGAYDGFASLWSQPQWRETIRLAVHYYTEANHGVTVESGLVLSLAGLELLTWALLVESGPRLTPAGFDRIPPSDKLRLLLQQLRVPAGIPEPLDGLAISKWVDGPHAITELRNGVVHAGKDRRAFNQPVEARVDAWNLSQYYLEIALLHLFNYLGPVINRLKRRHFTGDVEPVPWAAGKRDPTAMQRR